MHTAFHQEDELGDPTPKPTEAQLGAQEQGPITTESEAPRLAQEDAAKDFNRVKMGGFLMEFGLNILASNRDDAGGAIGDAGNKTMAARTERRRVSAAEELAKQERERRTRREDESDLLKQEKADREVAAEKRAAAKGERDKLDRIQKEDGTYEFVNVEFGRVEGEDGEELRGITKADWNKLNKAQKAIGYRHASDRLSDEKKAIRLRLADFDEKLIEELGEDPTEQEVTEHAWSIMTAEDKILMGGSPPSPEDYKERNWN